MLIWHSVEKESQDGTEMSYVGGVPTLPQGMEIPVFEVTGTEMTFFFQLAMPPGHAWEESIVSVFCATDYVDDDSHIPKIPVPLAQADLNAAFFQNYQTFFRLIVFEKKSAVLAPRYSEKVAFHNLKIDEISPTGCVVFGAVNSEPEWILEDESPRSYNGKQHAFDFLFQTKLDYEFETVANAPNQKVIDYASGSGLADSQGSDYTLFASNELYFYGMLSEPKIVYIVPQS